MRLLFVGTHYGGGGTESHFITLSKAMLAEGHEVAAVVRPGTPIHTGLSGSGVQLYHGVFRNAFDPRGILAVWRAIGDFQPDWVVGSFSKEYWPLAIIARLRGVKLALFKHMDFPLRFFTHHFIPRLAHRFIVISQFMRNNFIARGVDAARIQMLYNPLDLEYFRPDPQLRKTTRAQFGYADDDVVVGFIGAMHPDKGQLPLCDALNQAMDRNPKLKAIWVGDGLVVNELKARIQQGGHADRHIWHTWAKDVRPYYAALDILAAPTLVTETFGRVSIEAQASGLPVLCSNLGGLPETLQPDVTGKLLPVGDVAVWRDTILELAGNIQLRNQLSVQGRDWVAQHFSTAEIARQFAAMLGEAR